MCSSWGCTCHTKGKPVLGIFEEMDCQPTLPGAPWPARKSVLLNRQNGERSDLTWSVMAIPSHQKKPHNFYLTYLKALYISASLQHWLICLSNSSQRTLICSQSKQVPTIPMYNILQNLNPNITESTQSNSGEAQVIKSNSSCNFV